MSAPASRDRARLPASPPEPSSSARSGLPDRGRHGTPDSSPDSIGSASTPGGLAAGAGSAVRLLRRGLAAALLGLPLLAGLSFEVAALTFSGTTIVEGETKTFTITGFPASWTGTPTVGGQSTGNTASYKSSLCSEIIDLLLGVDVCLNAEAWDSTTRTLTLTLRAYEDNNVEGVEHFTLHFIDSDDSSRFVTQRFTVTPDLPAVTFSGPARMEEGGMILVNVTLSEQAKKKCYVKVRARRADGTVYGSTAFIAPGKTAGRTIMVHNNDSVWQESGHYDMPVYTAPGDCYAGIPRAAATYIVRVMDDGDPRPNRPPEFPSGTPNVAVGLNENHTGSTILGPPFSAATDPDGDTLTYTIEGTDAASFDIDSAARVIKSRAGVTYDHEAKHDYRFRIKVDDGRGGTDTLQGRVILYDTDEPPSAPAVTAVNATPGSPTSLDASWTAPDNTGKPAITSYDLRYRAGSSGEWTTGPQDVTGTSSRIPGLVSCSTHQVQVRATNDEGDGGWSNAGSGMTRCPPGTPVATFGSAASSAREDARTRNVTVKLDPTPSAGITLRYAVSGTAGSGDFGIAGSGSVAVGANAATAPILSI